MSMSHSVFVLFFKCEILMLDKFVSFISFIANCTLCITVEADASAPKPCLHLQNDIFWSSDTNNYLIVIIP
jgi:hypothetical protein